MKGFTEVAYVALALGISALLAYIFISNIYIPPARTSKPVEAMKTSLELVDYGIAYPNTLVVYLKPTAPVNISHIIVYINHKKAIVKKIGNTPGDIVNPYKGDLIMVALSDFTGKSADILVYGTSIVTKSFYINLQGKRPVRANISIPHYYYRVPITVIENSGNTLTDYQLNLTIDTASLIAQGKMRADCGDIRFTTYITVYELPITIKDNSGRNLTNYQVLINITDPTILSHITTDGRDIRFFNSSVQDPYQTTFGELPYYVEKRSNTELDVWVKVPFIPANGTTVIYMYYGNASATSESDPYSVFDFYDDFDTWSGWVQYGYGVVSQDCTTFGFCTLKKDSYGDPNGGYKALNFTLNYPFILEARVYRSYLSGCNMDRIGVIDDNGNGYGIVIAHDTSAPLDSLEWDTRSGYSGTSSTLVSNFGDITYKWYKIKWYWDNGDMGFYVYDDNWNLLASGTATDYTYSSFTRVYVFGGYTYFVDWIRIRKYANPPPTVIIGTPTQIKSIESKIPYYLESGCNTASTKIWVKVPFIPANGTTVIYMYYGNASATSESDPYSVFDFYDDFDTWSGWVQYGYGVVSQDCTTFGFCTLKKDSYGDPNGGYKALNFTLNYPFILEARVYRSYLSGCNMDRIGVIDDNGNGYGIVIAHDTSAPLDSLEWDTRSGYSGTSSTLVSNFGDITYKWYKIKWYWDNGDMGFYVYDDNWNLLASGTATDYTYSSFTRVYVFGGYTYFVDWIRIRKYANPPPTYILGPEEVVTYYPA